MADKFIPYARQVIDESDIDAVVEILRSDWLTQGPSVSQFEKDLTDVTGAAFASVVCNATAALHISCLALGLGKGDYLWTSPNSFVASANCGLYCGAEVDFVDIEPDSLNLSVEALRVKLEAAKSAGKLPKIVIPVHFSGQSCDMEAISELAQQYDFKVIEDASHAIGGKYNGEPIGNCRYSDITVFSFHPAKIITSGEGGAALTNDPDLAARLAMFRTHGVTRDENYMELKNEGDWYYEQTFLGLNYRITDLQCALGSSQLKRVDDFIEKRHLLADIYDNLLDDFDVRLPIRLNSGYSALHLYVIQLPDPERRREVFDKMRAAGIGVNVHYIPIHLQPYYRAMGFQPGDFPVAENYYARAITLPLHPSLEEQDLVRVTSTLETALQ